MELPGLPIPAVEFARLAAAAYDPATTPDFVAGSSEIYVTRLGDEIILTWRGSSDIADWRMDLWSVPGYAPDLQCWAHSGFLECAHQAWPILWFWLNKNPGRVWLCGHSKGAAEATVIAALMTRFGRPQAGLVTFGSPRVDFPACRGGCAASRSGCSSTAPTALPASLSSGAGDPSARPSSSAGPVTRSPTI